MRRHSLHALSRGVVRAALVTSSLVVMAPARALPGDWASLQAQVEADRRVHPAAHATVASILTNVAAHPPTRERRASPGKQLRALGKEALFPILGALSYDDAKLAALPANARIPLTVGMLEALRTLKDARAMPVLRGILEGPESDADVTRTAAEAMGALCDGPGLAYLSRRAVDGDPREHAALSGLGWCRTDAAARALLPRLSDGSSEATVKATVQALGWWGSSWAWATLDARTQEQGKAARLDVTRALVTSYLAQKGELRTEAGRSLLMLEHPQAPALLADASRNSDEQTRHEVALLLEKLSRSAHR